MKKIFTLLLGMGSLTAVFAQSGHSSNGRNQSGDHGYGQSQSGSIYGNSDPRNDRNQSGDHGYGQSQGKSIYDNSDHRNDGYAFSRERDAQIQRINWDFDNRIQAVKRDWYLRNGQKNRQILILENQRMEQIRQVSERFSRNKTVVYDNRSYKSNGRKY